MNIQDAINQYKAEEAEYEETRIQREKEGKERETNRTRKAFEKIGLSPFEVDGRYAYFTYNGDVVRLSVNAQYSHLFHRFVERCPKCGQELWTGGMIISLPNIGRAMIDPQVESHLCEPRGGETEEYFVAPEKGIRETLLDALDDYIEDRIQSREF